jgi:lipopolysaccharide export system protein LptC
MLSGSPESDVEIERSDGTIFTGRGFSANTRDRTWTFSGEVKGAYVEKED